MFEIQCFGRHMIHNSLPYKVHPRETMVKFGGIEFLFLQASSRETYIRKVSLRFFYDILAGASYAKKRPSEPGNPIDPFEKRKAIFSDKFRKHPGTLDRCFLATTVCDEVDHPFQLGDAPWVIRSHCVLFHEPRRYHSCTDFRSDLGISSRVTRVGKSSIDLEHEVCHELRGRMHCMLLYFLFL